MLLVAFAVSLSLQQTPPAAPSPARPPEAAPAVAVIAAEERAAAAAPAQVCRMEPVTGTRFGRRVCRSAVQTDAERLESRELLRRMQGSRVPPVG